MRRVLVGLLAVHVTATAAAGPLTPTATESAALQALAQKIPGARVLWVRGDKVYEARASNGFATTAVTQGSIIERNPRFSPDGSQILTVRSDGVYLMKSDFSGATKVIAGGHTASWTRDGKAITAIDIGGYKALQYDLASKSTTTIYDAQVSPYNGQKLDQAAELRTGGRFLLVFRLTPTHTTEIVDLQLKTYISNTEMERGDCSPSWAPDGSYFLTTARTTSRPVLRADFSLGASGGAVTASKHFVGLDTSEQFYIHGQRVANDGKHVTFGGKIFNGPLKSALREIYVWRIGDPESAAVRVSFDTAEDESPDLYVPAPAPLDGGPGVADGSSVPGDLGPASTDADLGPAGGDAGLAPTDGGSSPAGPDETLSGGCAVGDGGGGLPLWLILLFGAVTVRRAARSSAPRSA